MFGTKTVTLRFLIAAWRGELDALKCLFGHRASLAEENKDKQQALHCAAEGGHVKVLNFLIDRDLMLSIMVLPCWNAATGNIGIFEWSCKGD